MNIGSVGVSGEIFNISHCKLRDGKLEIKALRFGPAPGIEGPKRLYGEDGLCVMEGARVELDPIGPGSTQQLTWMLELTLVAVEKS